MRSWMVSIGSKRCDGLAARPIRWELPPEARSIPSEMSAGTIIGLSKCCLIGSTATSGMATGAMEQRFLQQPCCGMAMAAAEQQSETASNTVNTTVLPAVRRRVQLALLLTLINIGFLASGVV